MDDLEEVVEIHQTWWQQLKQHWVAIGVVAIVLVLVIVVIVLIIIGYRFDWTGFNGYNKVTITRTISGTNAGTVTRTEEYQLGKGLWDWLQLLGVLAIPVVVGFGAVWFTSRQTQASEANREKRHQTDLEIAEKNREREQETALQISADNQHEVAFRAYLDKVSELLVEKKLGMSAPDDLVREIARLQTLAVLLGLDPIRKANVILFLHESGLIRENRIVDLSYADLRSANLFGFDLRGANLSEANLSEAKLSFSKLNGVNLHSANLRGASLHSASLSGANLEGTNLEEADLGGVFLYGANLGEFNLSKVNFGGANLRMANLSKAYLGGANLNFSQLNGANLRAAYLSKATFYAANLSEADVTEEQLKKAKSLKGATMPDGSKHP